MEEATTSSSKGSDKGKCMGKGYGKENSSSSGLKGSDKGKCKDMGKGNREIKGKGKTNRTRSQSVVTRVLINAAHWAGQWSQPYAMRGAGNGATEPVIPAPEPAAKARPAPKRHAAFRRTDASRWTHSSSDHYITAKMAKEETAVQNSRCTDDAAVHCSHSGRAYGA